MEFEQLILVGHEGWVGVALTLMCDTIWCKFALYWGTGTWNFSPSGTGKAASFAPKQTVTTSGGEDNWFPHPPLKSFSVLENQYKVKRNFSSFFSHTSSRITSNFFESNKEPHQILLRQSKVSSSTCCCIYLMHKPPKKTSRIIHQEWESSLSIISWVSHLWKNLVQKKKSPGGVVSTVCSQNHICLNPKRIHQC